MQQRESDQLEDVWRWREHPPDIRQLSEGELIPLLRLIEERRGTDEDKRLDQAEAVVLTWLAALRLDKQGGYGLAEEWLSRAVRLDPSYRPSAELRVRLYLARLQEHHLGGSYPLIRETDNAATRRRHAEQLKEAAEAELQALPSWQALAAAAREAAEAAGDETAAQAAAGVERLYAERERLLGDMLERTQAYAASLQGMFYSAELLAALQESVKRLTAQQEEHERLLSIGGESAKAEKPGGGHSALEELEGLIGLDEIKERVRKLARFLRYRKLREEKGWHLADQLPLHLVLMGNPGTGKTTLARLIGRLYHELGLLERGDVVEVDRSHLVGAYVGQTEQRVMEAVKRAVGGVLFIDEAYSLKRADSSGSDYGQAAIDTLVAAMTGGEYAGRFVVMLAGYPEEMRQFLYANPGLRSRFPETGHFLLPDYTTDELLAIAEQVAGRNDFSFTPEARRALRQRIEQARVDHTFGNARTVTNIVMEAIFAKGRRLDEPDELQWDDFTILYPEDVGGLETLPDDQPAREKLAALIGLDEVKAELNKIAAFASVQRQRAACGLPTVPVELHAVFTGSPGTGKTTVARLYAEMLQEIGCLKRGHLVTAGRADLVAGYVGQTAALTRRKIREALGGVLFIDEAYALLEGGERDYGREAIHTLVEEMSRHGENLVVVLAGYPAEMQRLLASNPGLFSRFKKYLHFPDYTPDELTRMLLQAVAQAGYRLDSDVEERVRQQLDQAAQAGTLAGNGRLVHNLLQEAMQNQALRLTQAGADIPDKEQLSRLEWVDFQPLFADGAPASGTSIHEG
ncbi:AAA family ATPase [Brevibacillus thermoruber]|uniref:AAA family ATPase n=1 Tax=Brevibacillus thermoruber TaxID=33942 RepID=UPI0006891FCE|nr:AAA family ATPase [Brevibacillus thermoruber]